MYRHSVMFTWNKDTTDEAVTAVSEALDELAKLDFIEAFTHGPNVGANEGNWDYAVVADFASADEYGMYAADPYHLKVIADLIVPAIASRSAVQFEA